MGFLFNTSAKYFNLGLLFLRVGIGFTFLYFHGLSKITGGVETWARYGKHMQYFGIDFLPEFWGFMAAVAEFFGGFLLIIGLLTRPAAALIACTMIVAIVMKINQNEGFAYPLEMFIVVVSIFIMGAGKYSIDSRIR